MDCTVTSRSPTPVSRRKFLSTTLLSTALAPALLSAQQNQLPPYEPRDWSGNTPLHYPDPDIHALDPRFRRYILFNTPIRRHYIGTLWAEGPAAAFSYGVIFQIIDNYAGSKKTDMSLSSEIRLDTVMGTPLTMKADSCLVNMAAAASSGMNIPEK